MGASSPSYSHLGKSVIRIDAWEKVTGQAKYATDVDLRVPDMLHAKLVLSPVPHAKIISIDASQAETVPGFVAILLGTDVPQRPSGRMVEDQYLLAQDRVRYVGEPIAIIAARTIEAAERAAALVRVSYDELPALFDPDESMRADCEVAVHPDLRNYVRPLYEYLGDDCPGPNVHTHHKIRRGDVDRGFSEADLLVENTYTLPRISHFTPEPFTATAALGADGTLTIKTSMHQIFSAVQKSVCDDLGLPASRVRVVAGYIGGNFGAQANVERLAALAAMKTLKPVRLSYTREECFTTGPNRMSAVVRIKDGVKKDGTLVARKIEVIYNSGAYAQSAPFMIRNGAFINSQYRTPNFTCDGYGVYTNEVPSSPYRGFGNGPPTFAIEQQMDIIARKLGMDPVELRKKNLVHEGEENVRGEITHSIAAPDCLDAVAEWIGLNTSREPVRDENIRIGRGIALANKYTATDTISSSLVKVHKDGTIEVRSASDEVGQGCNTLLSQIAAEEFQCPISSIKYVWGDTALVPFDAGSISSRTTMHMGNALRIACGEAKRQILDLAASKLDSDPDDLEIENGRVFPRDNPEVAITFSDLFIPNAYGPQVDGAPVLSEGGELLGKSTFTINGTDEDPQTGIGTGSDTRLTASYAYVAQAAEVAVDVETGVVKMLRFAVATDVGKALNPKLCEAQAEGGAGMGIGGAIYEEIQIDKQTGKVLNPSVLDYRVPSALEVPSGDNFKVFTIESAPHQDGPYGAKGAAEAAMIATPPAIANAIFDAIGARIVDLPLKPENILKALRSQVVEGADAV